MTGRDTRRSFTITQRHEIIYQQNNKCAHCHKKLDPRAIEYHHIIPWADKGRTVTLNGAALCPDCHAIQNHKDRLKSIEKEQTPLKSSKKLVRKTTVAKPRKKKKGELDDLFDVGDVLDI